MTETQKNFKTHILFHHLNNDNQFISNIFSFNTRLIFKIPKHQNTKI